LIEIIHTFVRNVNKASSVFPFCHCLSIQQHNFHLGCSILRYWTSRTTSLELTQILKTNCSQLADFNWDNTNKWRFFIFGISFLLSYSSSQHNLRSDPVCKTHQLQHFWMNATSAYLFLICSTQQHRHQFHRPFLLNGAILEDLTYHTLLTQMYWQHD